MRWAFLFALIVSVFSARAEDPPRPSLEEELKAIQSSAWRQSKARDPKQSYDEWIEVTLTASGDRRYLGVGIRAQEILTGKEMSLQDYGKLEVNAEEIKGDRFFRFGKNGSIRYRLDGDKLMLDGKFPGMLVPDLPLSGSWMKVIPPPPKRKR